MFGFYFGKYLRDKGLLTQDKYDEILAEMNTARVKMGLMAVTENLMTTKQADEINRLQALKDKRFGDLAVEKGYLTDEQVGGLLKKQGDPYLLFVQGLTEKGILTLDEIDNELKLYQQEQNFSEDELAALKSGDIDRIVPLFIKAPGISDLAKEHIALVARNMVRFIDNTVTIAAAEIVSDYEAEYMARQDLEGDFYLLTAFCGDGIKEMAVKYGNEEFSQVDEDALDAVCEFLNCNNGLFASKLSEEDKVIDMLPPLMYVNPVKIRANQIIKIPFIVFGKQIYLLLKYGNDFEINS
ncbi:MAG: hypothetical protein FWE14_06800 [Lachnospiraceae bacterium]|nr:hypothetical protein [Lachnospiraceae bacterium]